MKRALFAALLILSLAMFAWTLRRFGRLVMGGRKANLPIDPGERLASVLTYFFGQKKVVEEANIPSARAARLVHAIGSKYHFVIFWGFIIITIGTGETLVSSM